MNKIYFLIFSLIVVFSSCYKYPELDYDYQNYNRVVGKDGGTIVFYSNYSNDSTFFINGVDSASRLLELTVPQGALDTDIVFNFYNYEDINNAQELSKGLSNVGSQFIYFVPVLASDGYHEHDNADLTYHMSLKFNQAVNVKYYFNQEKSLNTINQKKLQFEFYDRANANYRLYRLKIPEIDEWGTRNIFVQWNQQGYPIGYNSTDLNDIILGLWYPFSDADEYKASLTNWEQVPNVVFNNDNSISFDIESTDYIYVIAQVTNIPQENLPLKVFNYIQDNYNVSVERAAFIDQEFQVVLENNFILYFLRNGDFYYAEKYNISLTDIPTDVQSYIGSNYPGELIITNKVKIIPNTPTSELQYTVTLTNNDALLFVGDSSSVNYSGKIVYGYDDNLLISEITDYINTNFPNSSIENVISNDIVGQKHYVVYINYDYKNIKLYFDFSGNLLYSVYYGLKQDEISSDVSSYLDSLFPDIDLVSINLVYSADSIYYDIELLNEAYLEMSETAEMYYADYYVFEIDFPTQVKDSLSERFASTNVVEAYYHFETNLEYYWVGYQERLNVALSSNGIVYYAEGRNFSDLPPKAQLYIINNYGANNFSDFYYLEDNSTGSLMYTFHVNLDNGVLLFDRMGNFIMTGKANKTLDTKFVREEIKPITFD